jgi:carbon monoxide dehydrogenase subunit G
MELSHRFTVPTPVEETWAHFQDIASVAECFPGATVTAVEGDTFQGTCKVKLGPIALVYNGAGTFVERDEAAHRFVVDAKGKDKRGNGTAGAKVTLTMAESGGATDVAVHTDLAITGKPAQFGRGVMQDVSDKLLGQFVACLEARLSAPLAEPRTGAPQAAEAGPGAGAAAGQGAEPTAAPTGAAAVTGPAGGADGGRPAPAPAPATRAPQGATPGGGEDALDLGAAVLPVLLRSYWKQVAGALVVLLVLRWLFSRRR